MPHVGAIPGLDIHHGPGVAAIFRAEIARGDLILLHEFRIGEKQAGTRDRIVVVVLPVNLLVVVPPTEPVHGETRAVGVGEAQVAVVHHAGNKQGQTIQALVFQYPGKALDGRTLNRGGDLRLGGGHQRRRRRHFHGGSYFAQLQLDRTEVTVYTDRDLHVRQDRLAKARPANLNVIDADGEEADAEQARAVTFAYNFRVGFFIEDANLRFGHRTTLRIHHASRNRTLRHLRSQFTTQDG